MLFHYINILVSIVKINIVQKRFHYIYPFYKFKMLKHTIFLDNVLKRQKNLNFEKISLSL